MSEPFFSVVIPTRGRPAYLRDAVGSALLQSMTDLEVVVSDNHNDALTRSVVEPFESDGRLRYFRTDRLLSMPDHWEFATSKARGKYVLVLPDRKVLVQGALKHLQEVIGGGAERFAVVSFAVAMFDEERGRMGFAHQRGRSQSFTSAALIENFLTKNYYLKESHDRYFPKTMNSVYLRSFGDTVRGRFGGYFNLPGVMTPDYSSMMVNLALNNETYYVARRCMLTQGEKVSNGRLFSLGDFKAYMDSLGLTDPLSDLPGRTMSSYNTIVNDFVRVRDLVGGNLRGLKLHLPNFFLTNLLDLMNKEHALGSDSPVVLECKRQFAADIDRLPEGDKEVVLKALEGAPKRFQIGQRNAISLETLQLHIRDWLCVRLEKRRPLGTRLGLFFPGAMSAAGFAAPQHAEPTAPETPAAS